MKRKPATKEKAPESRDVALSEKAPTVVKVRLTKAQEQLLETLRDPACQLLDVSKICKLANVTRATYYNAFKDENFKKAYEAEMQAYRSMNEFQMLHVLIEKGKEGKNHNYQHMFWKMQGRLEEKTSKPAIVQVNFNVQRPPAEVRVINGEAEVVEDKSIVDE